MLKNGFSDISVSPYLNIEEGGWHLLTFFSQLFIQILEVMIGIPPLSSRQQKPIGCHHVDLDFCSPQQLTDRGRPGKRSKNRE